MTSPLTRFIALLLCALALTTVTSCRSHKETTVSTRTPGDVWGKKAAHKGKGGDKQGAGLVDEQWARLDIKLTRHDNKALYRELKRWLGTPYKYAHHTCGEGTDCSGMVMQVYLAVYDKKIERNTRRIYERNCRPIDKGDLREGDLVFFNNGKPDAPISHVGIYLKENKFVHASSSRGVIVSDLDQRYYRTHYCAAGRIID